MAAGEISSTADNKFFSASVIIHPLRCNLPSAFGNCGDYAFASLVLLLPLLLSGSKNSLLDLYTNSLPV